MKIILNDNSVISGSKPSPEETCEWWKWILSIPKHDNPLKNKNSDISQCLPFICLACTGGGEDLSRTFTINQKYKDYPILIPIFTSEYSTAELGRNAEYAELLEIAREYVKNPRKLDLIIDNQEIHDLSDFYIESPLFSFFLPRNNILDCPKSGYFKGVSAGYWMKISPFSEGQHTIFFGGRGNNDFYTKVGYTVKPIELIIKL